MCGCAKNSFDIIDSINQKRSRAGLDEVDYTWVMVNRRKHVPFLKPYRKIGNSFIWDGRTARKIVQMLWDLPYTPESKQFRYAA